MRFAKPVILVVTSVAIVVALCPNTIPFINRCFPSPHDAYASDWTSTFVIASISVSPPRKLLSHADRIERCLLTHPAGGNLSNQEQELELVHTVGEKPGFEEPHNGVNEMRANRVKGLLDNSLGVEVC